MNPERIFDKDSGEKEAQEIYQFFGFKEYHAAGQNLVSLIQLLGGDSFFVKNQIVRIFSLFKGVSDPDRAFNNFLRFLENTGSPLIHFNFIFQDMSIPKLLFRIFSDSQFFSNLLIRHPDFFDWLLHDNYGYQKTYEELLNEAQKEASIFAENSKKILSLRYFQKKQMLRIGANDISGKSSLEQTVLELSNVADVCMEMTYLIKKNEIARKNREYFDLAILSMGKLGGRELNYSSDIDILFIGQGNLALATQLAQEINSELARFSEEGYFYRVDIRLRPEGDRGELVIPLERYQAYFETRAKVWERQAYLKARVSAGERNLGNKLMALIGSFIFRKYLTIEEINSIKRLKKSIESKAHQKKEWEREVKIGYGGIRDIEFFIQLIQLIYGGKYSRLRTGNTLEALKTLYEIEFITYHEYSSLYQNYIFLRRVEHFLQIMDYRQTHVLPENQEKRAVLAVKLGFTLENFEKQYKKTTKEVRSIFKKYFEDVLESTGENLSDIFMNAEKWEDAAEILTHYGFQDTQSIFYLIKNTGITTKNELLFFSVLENICHALKANSFHPDKGLINIIRIIKAYQGEDTFFDIMKNSPEFLKILVKIASFSDFMVQIVEKNPAVLDFLTEPSILNEPTRRKDLTRIFTSLKCGMSLEKTIQNLFEMEIFRIGCQDILKIKTGLQISKSLSVLAETLLLQTIKEYSGDKKYRFAVIFLGRIAGREFSYHSDIDAVFVSESSDPEDIYKLSDFLQKILNSLNGVYKLDLRLRPNGKNSPLMVDSLGFNKYLQEKGANWERLAYSKSRVIADSYPLKEKIRGIIEDFVYQVPQNFKGDAIKMREKITASFPDEKNFKKNSGGIMDIEFILEYEKIKHKIFSSQMVHILRKLKKEKDMGFLNLELLEKNYLFFRELENALRLLNNHYSSTFPENRDVLNLIALKMGLTLEELQNQYGKARETTLKIWKIFKHEN